MEPDIGDEVDILSHLAVSPSLLLRLQAAAVFLGGATDVVAHIFAEEGDVGEIEVVGNLLYYINAP